MPIRAKRPVADAPEAASPQPRRRAARRPAPQPQPAESLYQPYDGPANLPPTRDEVTGQLVPTPRTLLERVDALEERNEKEIAEELLLSTLHQFILAKTPVDTICQRMGVSYQSYRWLREKLVRKIRDQVKARDPLDFLGPMIAEIEEAKAVAWREVAMAKPGEWTRRLRGIEVALRVNNDLTRMLQVAGMFDNSPMRAPLANDDADSGGANVLKDLASRFLSGHYAEKPSGLRPGDQIIGDA